MQYVPRPRKHSSFQRWKRYRYELALAYILACIVGERPQGLADVGKTYHSICSLAKSMHGSRYTFKRIAEFLRYEDEPQLVKLLADIRRSALNLRPDLIQEEEDNELEEEQVG